MTSLVKITEHHRKIAILFLLSFVALC